MSEILSLAQLRAQHARAVMAAKRHPSPSTRAGVEHLRSTYAEAKLAAYITDVVAKAPPLSPAQADRIVALLRAGGAS